MEDFHGTRRAIMCRQRSRRAALGGAASAPCPAAVAITMLFIVPHRTAATALLRPPGGCNKPPPRRVRLSQLVRICEWTSGTLARTIKLNRKRFFKRRFVL